MGFEAFKRFVIVENLVEDEDFDCECPDATYTLDCTCCFWWEIHAHQVRFYNHLLTLTTYEEFEKVYQDDYRGWLELLESYVKWSVKQ